MGPSTVGLTQEQAPACQEPVWSVGCLLVSEGVKSSAMRNRIEARVGRLGQNLVGMGGSGAPFLT